MCWHRTSMHVKPCSLQPAWTAGVAIDLLNLRLANVRLRLTLSEKDVPVSPPLLLSLNEASASSNAIAPSYTKEHVVYITRLLASNLRGALEGPRKKCHQSYHSGGN